MKLQRLSPLRYRSQHDTKTSETECNMIVIARFYNVNKYNRKKCHAALSNCETQNKKLAKTPLQ